MRWFPADRPLFYPLRFLLLKKNINKVPKGFRSFQHTVKFLYSNYLLIWHRFVPAPFSTNELNNNKINDGGNNQNEILFSLGKAINCIIIREFNPYFSLLLMSLDYVIL